MELKIGNVNKLIVKRETDIAYTLYPSFDESNEIFLHFNQATRRLEPKEEIDVFLYYDNKKRLCATMEIPTCTTNNIGIAEVVGVNDKAGCFMNIGIAKDILLSSDDLPRAMNGWPNIGDKLPIILKVKKNTLVAKIITRDDAKALNKIPASLSVKDEVICTVCQFTTNGVVAFTDNFEYIYIQKSLTRNKFHIGERIQVHIIGKNEFDDYLGSMIQQKEKMRLDDAQTILKYLDNFGGMMPLGNSSTPEEISRLLNMSKSAFKRAIGNLYKERLITIEENRILKNK